MSAYNNYWGKASAIEGSATAWHPLAYHSLDVAATTQAFLRHNPKILSTLAEMWHQPQETALRLATYLAGCHDLGKFSMEFQSKAPDLLSVLFPGQNAITETLKHSDVGLSVLLSHWVTSWAHSPSDYLYDVLEVKLAPLANATCGHHGTPVQIRGPVLRGNAQKAVAQFLADWEALLDIPALISQIWPALGDGPSSLQAWCKAISFSDVSWLLAGVISECDWVGSNQELFPYRQADMTLAQYWDHIQPSGEQAVFACSLMQKRPAEVTGFDTLFGEPARLRAEKAGHIFEAKLPTPLQHYADTVLLPTNGRAGLYLLEDETGAGKTEAALTLAARLVQSGHARGVFFCLPTQTTANAVFSRVLPVVPQFFAEDVCPSVTLAHGQAKHALSRMTCDVKSPGIGADLTSWASDSTKTALLADFGVGTVDQLALAGLPVRYVGLRHVGLAGKVLIVDEAHACEPYLLALVQRALTFHARMGGSAIILSATLPSHIKQALMDAFAQGCRQTAPLISSQEYPLATAWRSGGEQSEGFFEETPITARKEPRVLQFKAMVEHEEEALVAKWMAEGKCICIMRNTVSRAQESYARYVKLFPEKVSVVHARFMVQHRAENDAQLLSAFGPDSGPATRKGKLVIATQVAEQSLDVDFDEMISDIAPFDALLQRAGRWRRHPRDSNGNRSKLESRAPGLVYVIAPKAEDNERFLLELPQGTAIVYQMAGVLYRTARIIQGLDGFADHLIIPQDVRRAVEWAYSRDAEVPPYLDEAEQTAEGKIRGAQDTARVTCLKANAGYAVEAGLWTSLELVTRLGEPSMRLVLHEASSGPICKDDVSSSVAIRAAALRGAQLSSKAGKPYAPFVVMRQSSASVWKGAITSAKGQAGELRYCRQMGLRVHFS